MMNGKAKLRDECNSPVRLLFRSLLLCGCFALVAAHSRYKASSAALEHFPLVLLAVVSCGARKDLQA